MNYDKYYILCRNLYKSDDENVNINDFYNKPVNTLPIDYFDLSYKEAVNSLSEKVKKDFDMLVDSENDNVMIKHNNIWKFEDELRILSDNIVPYLEEKKFGCHLYVDKVYIYRTLKIDERLSSYEWHYDNNPHEIVKTLIYLNDVSLENSPFEYLEGPSGQGVLGNCTRKGTNCWYPAPNNSIVGHMMEELKTKGFKSKKIVGDKGTTTSFLNNTIHRANPIMSGYRDVANIRVKPTIKRPPVHISKSFTTSYEYSGVVNRDPEISWKSLI